MSNTPFTPAEVFPPGEFIREELEARGWSQSDLAEILGRPPRLVSELVGGKRTVTPETAKGLAQAFGTSAELWLNLESSYQLSRIKEAHDDVARRARLYDKVPVNEIIRRGWIHRSASVEALEQQVCRFLEIGALDEQPRFLAAARKSDANVGWSAAQVAWLARVRQLAASMTVPSYSKAKFSTALGELRGLLTQAEDVRKAPGILEQAGIRCVIVEPLSGTSIDGACLWLDGRSPVIGLSFRYDRIDWFWFTLLHELGHVKHEDGRKAGPVLDVDLVGTSARVSEEKSKVELRADQFATEFLIDQRDLNQFVAETGDSYSTAEVLDHAARQKVHAGIVVGQLQHRKLVPSSHFRLHLAKVRNQVIPASKTDGWGVVHAGKPGNPGKQLGSKGNTRSA